MTPPRQHKTDATFVDNDPLKQHRINQKMKIATPLRQHKTDAAIDDSDPSRQHRSDPKDNDSDTLKPTQKRALKTTKKKDANNCV